MNNFSIAMNNSIERSGTGIEKTGTGIERSGTGIERSGTGIERSGTGIERSGTGVSRGLFVAMALALSSVAPLALADKNDPAAVPAQVDVREDAVSLTVGAPGCALQGTGWQKDGYVRIPLALALNEDASILVAGSGSGDRVAGSGSGNRVAGSGSGDRVAGSGSGSPSSFQVACSTFIEAFAIEVDQKAVDAGAWTQVWGVAELAIDNAEQAAVLVYPGGVTSQDDAIALNADITIH